jgi:hypothetical protein
MSNIAPNFSLNKDQCNMFDIYMLCVNKFFIFGSYPLINLIRSIIKFVGFTIDST